MERSKVGIKEKSPKGPAITLTYPYTTPEGTILYAPVNDDYIITYTLRYDKA